MINPGQFVLEFLLVVTALAVTRSLPAARGEGFALRFAVLAAAVNCAFYFFAVGPLYRARGLGREVLVATVIVETLRWGVLALVLSRLALRQQQAGATIGFALRGRTRRWGTVVAVGTAAGVLVTGALYLLSFAELRAGILQRLPWPIASGEPLDVRLVLGGGVRNLVGEEVFARLGAQGVALHFLRRVRGGAGLAIIVSALYFEIWHNPFEVPQLLNFTASCILGWVYHKHGYEAAAIGHCVADWLMLAVLPALLFG